MSLALYLDDDHEARAIVRHAIQVGWDVLRSTDAGMRGRPDDEHLEFALKAGRVIVTSNVADFYELHTAWLMSGKGHAGIILIKQQTWSIGEVLLRLERLLAARTPQEMVNCVEWLADWGDENSL